MNEERWIGERARIGIAIPSTNIAVEYDCQRIIPEGVTWHFGRFFIEMRDLSDDAGFLRFVEAIQDTIPLSMRDLVTAEITYAMMGMSAETFWGGRAGNEAFQAGIREIIGPDMGLTTGAEAADAALKAFGIQDIAVLTPYQPVADEQVRTFFGESGYNIKRLHGLKCDSAHGIANTPRAQVLDIIMNELDGDDIDAIVQVGTNLSTIDMFPTLEHQLGKPMIAINVALIWHALRAAGIDDKFFGRGRLLEEF
jgi:maleate isomerase